MYHRRINLYFINTSANFLFHPGYFNIEFFTHSNLRIFNAVSFKRNYSEVFSFVVQTVLCKLKIKKYALCNHQFLFYA